MRFSPGFLYPVMLNRRNHWVMNKINTAVDPGDSFRKLCTATPLFFFQF